ncbi:unnamed protein product [Arctia plantaginis]|uniref:Chaoptin n=1 Tax=Arctia plantaginis TaxID=874455 RepID=A0A8S0YU99_ARCPL|nr:unnamed protein product [Arctia plantaginis]
MVEARLVVLNVAAALLLATGRSVRSAQLAPRPASPVPCAANGLCYCRTDHFTCSYVPFYRFPETGTQCCPCHHSHVWVTHTLTDRVFIEADVWHISVMAARLGSLSEAALDGRRLRTLVLVASSLHHIETGALASMVSTLASLDLGYNKFTEVPLSSLRELKVLNWLNLQNNYINVLDASMDWGFLGESLTSLSLSNNHLYSLSAGALSALRRLAQLDLDGNRLHGLSSGALPPTLAILRLSDNLLQQLPCAALAKLPRLRHLHLRNNVLRPINNHTCRTEYSRIDSLDLSHNELDDSFSLEKTHYQLRQLVLDFNDFTSVPTFVADNAHLEKLSIAYNSLSHVSDATLHALRHDLERLELDHNELVTLAPGVRELVRLRHLSAAYNRLAEAPVLPPRLHSLSLAGNYLTNFPTGLQSLAPATLVYLDLSYNQLISVISTTFGEWSAALTTLNLKGNRISQLSTDAFPATLPLRELTMSFNELYHVDARVFSNLRALSVLEFSSALFSGEFPLSTPLEPLSWLTLDNNNIHHVSSNDIFNFPSLEYLNLDFNKIVEFPTEVSDKNRSSGLKELRLSYNYIAKINFEFLVQLSELQSVDLSYNRVNNLSEHSFASLLNVVYINLAGNALDYIGEHAFYDLPKLEVLDLQENYLVEFSTEYFRNVSSKDTTLSVNASYNRVSTLVGGGQYVLINILDLSYNFLGSLSRAFFDSLGTSLRQLILSNNRLTHIDNLTFSALSYLEILSLRNNNISAMKRRAFTELDALQILDLSRNRLEQLSVEQFHNMRRLRHLRLDENLLRSIPRDCFKNTVLEHIDLSYNQLYIFPSSSLAQVGFTLRCLELSHNHIEYLDTAMFNAIAFLHELNLAHNALTVLSDNSFAGLSRLQRLDLSYNTIKTNFKELFHNVPRLRNLALVSAGLRVVPHLPLTNLTELDLSGNHIASYRENEVRRLGNVRKLVLARNKFTSLQPAMWAMLPKLTSLDVSNNPIVRISSSSFKGLPYLLRLRIDNLHHLEAIEPRAFRSLTSLRMITLESPDFSGRSEVTVADIAACVLGLESLEVHISGHVLDLQLRTLHVPKLRVLDIRGANIRRVAATAFAALGRQRALSLRFCGTGVTTLPAGLLHPLARVPHLALDLSDNQLDTFAPSILYPNMTGWNRFATKLLPGGLVISGNPLRCGCGVQWIGAWLRRWCMEVGGGSAQARSAALRSTCKAGAAALPLLGLDSDEAQCHASALSGRAARCKQSPPGPPPLLWLVLLYVLS